MPTSCSSKGYAFSQWQRVTAVYLKMVLEQQGLQAYKCRPISPRGQKSVVADGEARRGHLRDPQNVSRVHRLTPDFTSRVLGSRGEKGNVDVWRVTKLDK